MRFRKIITITLSALIMFETPFVSLAASVPSDSVLDTSPIDEDPAIDITLNYDTYSLKVGDTLKLTANTEPLAEIEWTSENEEVASVSSDGLVTAHKAGTADITATATVETENGPATAFASCTVQVKNLISLDKNKLTIYTCQTGQLNASAQPAGTITWTSSDPKVATVKNGKIKPLKAGKTEITASANNVSATCMVTVKDPSLNLRSKMTVYLHNPIILDAEATPKGDINWKSSDSKIAVVNAKGKVTPKKTGTAVITATCNGVKKTCNITVKKPSVKLKDQSVILFAKNSYSLNVAAEPSDKLQLVSSDPSVVKVSGDGTITGVGKGTAEITASVPGAKATCQVTVLDNPYKLSRTSQVLMKGNSTTLYLNNVTANERVTFGLSDNSSGVVTISASGNSCKITAKKAGTVTVNAYCSVYTNNEWVTCKCSCKVKVLSKGVIQQQTSLAVKAKKTLVLKNVEKAGIKIKKTTWTSSDPKVASVGRATGIVTGKNPGSARITATVSYSDGTSVDYPTDIRISNPKVNSSYTVLAVGAKRKIKLTGLNSYSTVKWKIDKSLLAFVDQDGTVKAGYASGKAKITITVDGKKIAHQLIVTNPGLSGSYKAVALGETMKIAVNGISDKSKITYKSKNTSIATVNKSGVVTAKQCGNVDIVVTADGMPLTFQVNVAPKRAVSACESGYGIINSSTYSQARRMSQGYYDCSSLVFRAYGCDTQLLGGISSWAPTAAAMASYLEKNGKIISYGGIPASKLLPGDLIFFSTSAGNGRYRNINHVSMYYGGGYRLEKPLRYYYMESNITMIARPIR